VLCVSIKEEYSNTLIHQHAVCMCACCHRLAIPSGACGIVAHESLLYSITKNTHNSTIDTVGISTDVTMQLEAVDSLMLIAAAPTTTTSSSALAATLTAAATPTQNFDKNSTTCMERNVTLYTSHNVTPYVSRATADHKEDRSYGGAVEDEEDEEEEDATAQRFDSNGNCYASSRFQNSFTGEQLCNTYEQVCNACPMCLLSAKKPVRRYVSLFPPDCSVCVCVCECVSVCACVFV
jgi:hypothetical protein